jgi:hypothetical protein
LVSVHPIDLVVACLPVMAVVGYVVSERIARG